MFNLSKILFFTFLHPHTYFKVDKRSLFLILRHWWGKYSNKVRRWISRDPPAWLTFVFFLIDAIPKFLISISHYNVYLVKSTPWVFLNKCIIPYKLRLLGLILVLILYFLESWTNIKCVFYLCFRVLAYYLFNQLNTNTFQLNIDAYETLLDMIG